jgi:fructose-1,6-bisphosphatase I/sedoheptulose-1,7-bisphosphatase
MQPTHRSTLTQFLIEERSRFPAAKGDLNGLILDVAIACKAIARAVALGGLGNAIGYADTVNVQGEAQQKLDILSNNIFLSTNTGGGYLAAMASEEMELPYQIPSNFRRGKYLLLFDPLDGSTNVDINVSVGSIFSILRSPEVLGKDVDEEAFFQCGTQQVAAGYALYGPSTMFVLTVGRGTHGFTLDPNLGEFMLTHPSMRIPERTQEFAINASNSRFWDAPIQRYVNECLAGRTGPRGKDYNTRWIASMVADAHRILVRGGVYLYPRDTKDPQREGRLRLLYEANPVAFLIEQAGGMASTGRRRMLDIKPSALHQRIGLVFGSSEEVSLIEQYHNEPQVQHGASPLFSERGLFSPQV